MSNIINKIFNTGKRNTKQSGYPQTVSQIGEPFEVRHNVHVGFNIATGKIEGLPEPWLCLINGSNITPQEQAKNPQAVINALKLLTHNMSHENKYLANQDMINNELQEIEDAWPRSKESSKVLLDDDDDQQEQPKHSKFYLLNDTSYQMLTLNIFNFTKQISIQRQTDETTSLVNTQKASHITGVLMRKISPVGT